MIIRTGGGTTLAAHLRRGCLLLDWISREKGHARVVRQTADVGGWKELAPRWRIHGAKILLTLHAEDCLHTWALSTVRIAAHGADLVLSHPVGSLPAVVQVVWRDSSLDDGLARAALAEHARKWLRDRLPGAVFLSIVKRPDLSNSIGGGLVRLHVRSHGKDYVAVVARADASSEETNTALTHALLWVLRLRRSRRLNTVPKALLLVPRGHAGVLVHRAKFLNRARIRAEVWEFARVREDWVAGRAVRDPAPVEERDFRWPLLERTHVSASLDRVLELAPESIRRYPCFSDYDSLRLSGLEFARAHGPNRDRITYGIGGDEREVTDANFADLCCLVREILYFRRGDSPDPRHVYYRLQAERWLESLILEFVETLFPELLPGMVYSQIPVYLGQSAGRVDILAADRDGTLVVLELKVSADPYLPIQCLDYWARVIRHNQNGDFERRGYFGGLRLSRRRPKIYLVSPIFSFHDSTERVMGYLDPDLEMWKISINEDWRCGVKILRRIRFRCGDLE
jgi:hypothetical protein